MFINEYREKCIHMKKMVILATVVCVLAFGFTGFSSTANVENQTVEFDAELPTRPLVEKPKEEPKIEIPSIEVPKETPKEEPTVPSTEEEPKPTEPTREYHFGPPTSTDGVVTDRKAIVQETKETEVNVTEEVPQEIPVVENDPQPVPVVENAIPRTGDSSMMIIKMICGLVILSFVAGNVCLRKKA